MLICRQHSALSKIFTPDASAIAPHVLHKMLHSLHKMLHSDESGLRGRAQLRRRTGPFTARRYRFAFHDNRQGAKPGKIADMTVIKYG